jgi:hypothetical protein
MIRGVVEMDARDATAIVTGAGSGFAIDGGTLAG